MKRSTQIGLGAAGVLLVASTWSMFGGEKERISYSDIAECKADGRLQPGECEARFAEAEVTHVRDARRFSSTGECEAEYGAGRCETFSVNGSSIVVPALAGMMLARTMFGRSQRAEPLLPPARQACPPGSSAEECRTGTRSGGTSSGGGYGSSSRSSRSQTAPSTSGSSSVAGGASHPSVASRGGFGSTGHAFGASSS